MHRSSRVAGPDESHRFLHSTAVAKKRCERRRFDMRPLLRQKPWNRIAAPHLFKHARVEHGTVMWPGEIDIAPETLYQDSGAC